MPSRESLYEYANLQTRDHNRLLTVLADVNIGPLHCRLEETPIAKAPRYYTLSYFWGNSTPGQSLQIGDRIIIIRQNVFATFRRFRMALGTFTIWVDAVCINQTNTSERSAQMFTVREIYEERQKLEEIFDPRCRGSGDEESDQISVQDSWSNLSN